MGFIRDRLAKRLEHLKEAGVEMPVTTALVPGRATIVSEGAFPQSTFEERGQVLERLKIPAFAYGKAYGKTAGLWYRVPFPKTIMNPSVVAVCEARAGAITRKRIDYMDIPKVRDVVTREIARVRRDDFNSDYYCTLVAQGARDRVNKLSPPWPLNLVWDFIVGGIVYYGFYAGWYASGWILNVLWDSFVQPQIDRVRDSINSVIGDVNIKVNEQLTAIRDATRVQLDRIIERVNLRLDDLYAMWGIPKTIAITPAQIRKVTSTGFEFLSLGTTTIYYIAVGLRSGEAPPRV